MIPYKANGRPPEPERRPVNDLVRARVSGTEPPKDQVSRWMPPDVFGVNRIIEEYREERQPVVYGLLRRGDVGNLVGASKSQKSWFAMDLAIHVATGRPFLAFEDHRDRSRAGSGGIECWPGRVLVVDNELHRDTIAKRMRMLLGKRNATVSDDRITFVPLRGHLAPLEHVCDWLLKEMAGYDLVILDALYRFIREGVSENDNAAVTQMYNLLDRTATEMKAAILCIHHSSKGVQATKSVTDVGSGAGAQSRAADAHIVIRPHQDDNTAVLEAAVRSFEPLEPVAMRWDYPVWHRVRDVDTKALKGGDYKSVNLSEIADFVVSMDPPPTKKGELVAKIAEVFEVGQNKASKALDDAVKAGFLAHETGPDGRYLYRASSP